MVQGPRVTAEVVAVGGPAEGISEQVFFQRRVAVPVAVEIREGDVQVIDLEALAAQKVPLGGVNRAAPLAQHIIPDP
jgi:hypothetical protein